MCLIYIVWCVKRYIFMGVRIYLIISNPAEAPYVSISNHLHYGDVIMDAIASQITSLAIVYSIGYSDADQRKTSKLRVTGLCAGNSPGTGEFSAQMASYAENISIWWRHQEKHDNLQVLNSICRMKQLLMPPMEPTNSGRIVCWENIHMYTCLFLLLHD